MKFLVDQNRSPRLAALLVEAGHDAVHTFVLGLAQAEDIDLVMLADKEVGSSFQATPTSELCWRCQIARVHR